MATPVAKVTYRKKNSITWLLSIVFVSVSLVVLTALIAWQAATPKKLRYSVERASVTGYNITADSFINAAFRFVLRTENPNRCTSFHYRTINATMRFENQTVCSGSVPRFSQLRRNVTDLEVNLTAANETAARELRTEKTKEDLKVELTLSADVRVQIGAFQVSRSARVNCSQVMVPISPSGKFQKVPCHASISL